MRERDDAYSFKPRFWDIWPSKEEAMQAYVDLAKELVGKPVEDVLAE